MSRKNNIELGKLADKTILNHIESLDNVLAITEIRDTQGKLNRTPTEEMENSINQYLGVDYILTIEGNRFRNIDGVNFDLKHIDTKGFTYTTKNYGGLYDNGIPEFLLMQVEKQFSDDKKYYGWSNDPKHLTDYIVILINNRIIWLDYKKLSKYMLSIYDPFRIETEDLRILNRFLTKQYDSVAFKKKETDEINICLKIPTIELFQNGVMTGFYEVENNNEK